MILVEASEIVPNLWQGSFPLPGTRVRDSGFTMLVLCAKELQEPAESYPGVRVVHAPNYDDGNHSLTRGLLEVALQAASQVVSEIQAGGKVLVTCRAGLNRSGLVSALALHLMLGWSGSACIEQIRTKRKTRYKDLPVSNPEFVAALKRLDPPKEPLPKGWVQSPSGLTLPKP